MKNISAILGERILFVGLGKSGLAALNLIKFKFPDKVTFTFDDSSTLAQTKLSDEALAFKPTSVIVSPGYPLTKDWLVKLRINKVPFLNELDLASFFLSDEKAIGVTGSIGKSTTAALIFEAAKVADPHVFLGGNFGTPLCEYVIKLEKGEIQKAVWLILELSSYHLETLRFIKLEYGIITYFTPNHLERYATLLDYYQTKWNIRKLGCHKIFINLHSIELKQSNEDYKFTNVIGVHLDNDKDFTQLASQAKLIGLHNQQNILLALKIIKELKWPQKAIKNVLLFPGLPHRLENLGFYRGSLIINDSKSTSIESTIQAVESVKNMVGKNELYLLIGGKDKNLPWERIHILRYEYFIKPVFFGESAENARRISGLDGPIFPKLKPAVEYVLKRLNPQDICLLSPGGTSLDEFKNFEDRGQQFKKYVFGED